MISNQILADKHPDPAAESIMEINYGGEQRYFKVS
jgi:hypothetical protein